MPQENEPVAGDRLLIEVPQRTVGARVELRPLSAGDGAAVWLATQESLDDRQPWQSWQHWGKARSVPKSPCVAVRSRSPAAKAFTICAPGAFYPIRDADLPFTAKGDLATVDPTTLPPVSQRHIGDACRFILAHRDAPHVAACPRRNAAAAPATLAATACR